MIVALWQHFNGECLLRGNQPPRSELSAEDRTLPSATSHTLGPRFGGAILSGTDLLHRWASVGSTDRLMN